MPKETKLLTFRQNPLPRGDGVYEIMLSGDARPEQITLLYR